MTLVILGPQGAGKGTQAKLLAKDFNLNHVSIGDLLRSEVAKKSELGLVVEKYMTEGKLIPAELNNELVKSALAGKTEVLLDGFPRNLEQASFLFDVTGVKGLIVIDLSEDESVDRLSKRLICTANNKIFVEGSVSKEDEDECFALGGKIIKRPDDFPDAIKNRLRIYHDETLPVVNFFKEKGVPVISVEGNDSVENIHEVIKSKFSVFS